MAISNKRIKILCGIILILIFITGCGQNQTTGSAVVDNPGSVDGEPKLEIITLEEEGTIIPKQCSERGLSDKIIMLESKYCGHCRIAVPMLKELENELQIKITFLDLSKEEDLEKTKEFKIMPKYTPILVVGCNVYIGAKSKEEYKQIIENFLKAK